MAFPFIKLPTDIIRNLTFLKVSPKSYCIQTLVSLMIHYFFSYFFPIGRKEYLFLFGLGTYEVQMTA